MHMGSSEGSLYLVRNNRSAAIGTDKMAGRLVIAGMLLVLLLAATATTATAQTSYTFTSGFAGDGFDWPESPTGLLDGDSFNTPESIQFYNWIGNNLFFDSQYQVAGNAPGITDEAMWGNPLDTSYGTVDILFNDSLPQSVAFDFAWSVAGSPFATPDNVEVYLEDSDGRATVVSKFLSNTFTGFGGFDGYADRIAFIAGELYDDFEEVDGGQFIDIAYIYVYVDAIITGGPASEFAIDNFDVDGGIGGDGELFPSVNGGTVDISDGTLAHSVLRGTGMHAIGFEVTNGTTSHTTYSTQLLPGGELMDAGQIDIAPIFAGQTLQAPPILSISRSLPSDSYTSGILLINDEDPFDPDNTFYLQINLIESPSLTTPNPVDVIAGDKVQLINAAVPANGFRASVEVTGTAITGPFSVTGYDINTPAKPGEMIEGVATFDRFGRLSGSHGGIFTASLQMTIFAGVNNDIEVFLFGAAPVADAQWTLNATLADTPSDDAAYATGEPLGPGLVGVNSANAAATILAGTSTANGSVSMTLEAVQAGSSTATIGGGAEVSFTTAAPVHVVQMTYRDAALCPDITEANVRLLYFNGVASDWQLAVDGNSGGGATFVAGSFQDFADTLGGAPLSSALGTHGVDTANNHVWAIVNHEAAFGVGEIGQKCLSPADFDEDGDVDQDDVDAFEACASGPAVPLTPGCEDKNLDGDDDVDQRDFAVFQRCYSGTGNPADPNCAD